MKWAATGTAVRQTRPGRACYRIRDTGFRLNSWAVVEDVEECSLRLFLLGEYMP